MKLTHLIYVTFLLAAADDDGVGFCDDSLGFTFTTEFDGVQDCDWISGDSSRQSKYCDTKGWDVEADGKVKYFCRSSCAEYNDLGCGSLRVNGHDEFVVSSSARRQTCKDEEEFRFRTNNGRKGCDWLNTIGRKSRWCDERGDDDRRRKIKRACQNACYGHHNFGCKPDYTSIKCQDSKTFTFMTEKGKKDCGWLSGSYRRQEKWCDQKGGNAWKVLNYCRYTCREYHNFCVNNHSEPDINNNKPKIDDPTSTAEPNLDPTLQPTVTLSEYTIQNDQIWYDTEGETVWASMGGHISKFNGMYYWVGTDPRINDSSIRIYSSNTLGSNTWKFECYVLKREGTDSEGNKLLGKRNCSLLFCPETQKYVVICKGVTIYESTMTNQIVGSYEMAKKINTRTILSGVVDNVNNFMMGGMSAYYKDDRAYFIISIKNKQTYDRHVIIVETTPNFLDVQRHVLWLPIAPQRESFWLFRRDGKYYMTYDGPGGWMGSDCYYRIADNLEGPWTEEVEISFDPEPTERKMRSHASQHRYIMNVDGQWIYGGDRYPYQEAESHSPEKGLHIMCPIEWDGDHPTVVWEKRWNVNAYS